MPEEHLSEGRDGGDLRSRGRGAVTTIEYEDGLLVDLGDALQRIASGSRSSSWSWITADGIESSSCR